MIYTGTSGYSYADWKGTFYPEKTKDGEMLPLYAEEFDFTEINSTYYRMPSYFVFRNLNEKTPENFVFTVKAFSGFTHTRDAAAGDAEKFTEALKPVSENGKLGCIVFQFPFSFHNNKDSIGYLEKIREYFKNEKIVFEFRNSGWAIQETMGFLKDRNIGWVCVDEPDIKGLIRPAVAVTSKVGYVRFHGRNKEKWYNHKESYERYDYQYSEDELKEWTGRINFIEKNSEITFIAFNNHFRAQGAKNAIMLRGMLGG